MRHLCAYVLMHEVHPHYDTPFSIVIHCDLNNP